MNGPGLVIRYDRHGNLESAVFSLCRTPMFEESLKFSRAEDRITAFSEQFKCSRRNQPFFPNVS